MSLKAYFAAAALASALTAGSAMAATITYPDSGTTNTATYSFTATNTGELMGYFAGSSAAYDEKVGVTINGIAGPEGLEDNSAVGKSFDFGHVTAGDVLVFYDDVITTGDTWYSVASKNTDKTQHVYSTSAAAGAAYAGSPAGTYIAFEDEAFPGADKNYHDDTFVFTNTSTNGVPAGGVPEPAAWALMLTGVSAMGMALRARRRTSMAAI